MSFKSIEIYYDIADIPDISDRGSFSGQALEFRNDAMEHIEVALENAGAGEWEGAEIGSSEVNFGFSVQDHDHAEKVVRASVAGTDFDCIREIQRREITQEDMAQYEANASDFENIKPMTAFELIVALVFRRVPKRWRVLYQNQNSTPNNR